jgi:RNase adaptor protein for sRNA GlmZ degradation
MITWRRYQVTDNKFDAMLTRLFDKCVKIQDNQKVLIRFKCRKCKEVLEFGAKTTYKTMRKKLKQHTMFDSANLSILIKRYQKGELPHVMPRYSMNLLVNHLGVSREEIIKTNNYLAETRDLSC